MSLHPVAQWMPIVAVGLAWPAQAQEDDLQKKLANPISDLITIPMQLTSTANVGPLKRPEHILNIQPVYPVKLGGMALINRLIVPVMSMPAFAPDEDRKTGLGDITYEGFFSPPGTGGLVWGVGPIVQLRTASDDRLGTGKWSAGPAFVAVQQSGAWSVGALVTQLWSFAGDDSRAKVNQTQIQPLLSYRLDAQHSIAYTGTLVANWEQQRSSQRWTVPLGLTYSILTKPAGFVPVNYIVGAGYNAVRPDTAGDWFLRLQVNFILTK